MIHDDGREYLDVGERVRVKKYSGFTGRPQHRAGEEGVIVYNNGWGLCTVVFDNGSRGNFYNDSELEEIQS